MLPKGMAGIAAVGDDPLWYPGQTFEQTNGLGQFVRLTWCQAEGDGATATVGDHTGLRSIGLQPDPTE
jgi:alpha-glucuronidase